MKHELSAVYKNVRIRPVDRRDLEALRAWRNNPENTKYLSKIPYITSDMQAVWYDKSLTVDGEFVFAIDEIVDLKRFVGSCSLYNISTRDKNAEFGKFLIGDTEAHGKRVGVNSLFCLLNLCFSDLNLDLVYLHVFKDNEAAVKVHSQAGFKVVDENLISSEIELKMAIDRDNFNTLKIRM